MDITVTPAFRPKTKQSHMLYQEEILGQYVGSNVGIVETLSAYVV